MKYVLTFIASVFFLYFLFSFGNAELDFRKWDGLSRAFCAMAMAFGSIMSVVLHVSYDQDNKK
jgi:hypothetical protein